MGKKPVQVTIINDPLYRQDCDVSCGADWSSMTVLEMARRQLKEKFGDDINLTYMDIAADSADEGIIHWIHTIKQKKLGVPLLIINGQIRIAGNFDIRQMMDVIEVEREMGV